MRQHTQDSYAGLGMSKFPEDLRTYEHLLWLQRPDTVIEIGVQFGASALWFRDRLRTLRAYGHVDRSHVIGIDVDASPARTGLARTDPDWASEITLIEADVRDPALPARVRALLPPDARCMVIEDSAHLYDTTRAALEGFSGFVPENGFFVVEDGCIDIDELRLDPRVAARRPSGPRGLAAHTRRRGVRGAARSGAVRRLLPPSGLPPASERRRPAEPRSRRLSAPLVLPDRLVSELEVVPAADEEAERAASVAVLAWRRREATPQELERGLALLVERPGVERRADVPRGDARDQQALLDAVRPPAVERPAILGEAPRVAGVVDGPLIAQRRERLVDQPRLDLAAFEVAADLQLGALAPGERPVGQVEDVAE